jgi:hypothetical protein
MMYLLEWAMAVHGVPGVQSLRSIVLGIEGEMRTSNRIPVCNEKSMFITSIPRYS